MSEYIFDFLWDIKEELRQTRKHTIIELNERYALKFEGSHVKFKTFIGKKLVEKEGVIDGIHLKDTSLYIMLKNERVAFKVHPPYGMVIVND